MRPVPSIGLCIRNRKCIIYIYIIIYYIILYIMSCIFFMANLPMNGLVSCIHVATDSSANELLSFLQATADSEHVSSDPKVPKGKLI